MTTADTTLTPEAQARAGVIACASVGEFAEAAHAWQTHLNAEWAALEEQPGAWTPDWSRACQAAQNAANEFFRAVINDGASVAVGHLIVRWSE